MIIKSFDFDTKVRVGDCAPSYNRSWELDLTDGVYTFTVDGFSPEILEQTDRDIHYYLMRGMKKKLRVLESRGFKQWIYAQWQSGDVWGYCPYLSKLERDVLVYGNAQWAEIASFGD
jgi:hypothetical protein